MLLNVSHACPYEYLITNTFLLRHDGTPGKSMRSFPIGHGRMGKYTFSEKSVDAENFYAALKSSGKNLVTLIQNADGMAAKSR